MIWLAAIVGGTYDNGDPILHGTWVNPDHVVTVEGTDVGVEVELSTGRTLYMCPFQWGRWSDGARRVLDALGYDMDEGQQPREEG